MKKSLTLITLSSAFFLAGASTLLAQSSVQAGMGTFADIVNTFNKTVVQALGALFMSGAVVAFFYGLANFIWGLRGGEPKAISAGKEFMLWALIALFVMFSVYGIIKFFQGTLLQGYSPNTIILPEIKFEGGSGGSAGSGTQNPPSQKPDGSQCSGPWECSSGYCSSSVCTIPSDLKPNGEQCSRAVECSSNYCTGGVCVLKPDSRPIGAQCTSASQCLSNYCENTPYNAQCAINPNQVGRDR